MNKPKCAVNGMVRPGAMCGSVIVGGEFCGHDGACQHKTAVYECLRDQRDEGMQGPCSAGLCKWPDCKPSNAALTRGEAVAVEGTVRRSE